MKLQKYFLCAAVAVAAFALSLGLTDVGQYLRTVFLAETKKVEPAKTLTVAEITYPRPVVESDISRSDEKSDPEIVERKFSADGDYYILGDLPKGLKDFEILSIITHDYEKASEENDFEGVPIPPKGYLEAGKEFHFTRINIANKQISLKTEAKQGISYEFVGEFIEEEAIEIKDKNGDYTDYIVLKGRLKKMRDGKKIAESQVKFALSRGC